MSDQEVAEAFRAVRMEQINKDSADRAELELRHSKVWNSFELAQEFRIVGHALPFFIVERRKDGVVGSVERQERPRFYFNFIAADQERN